MLEKTFKNEELGIKLTSFIDNQQNTWFLGKEVAESLGYSNVRKAIWNHVDSEDKKLICWRTQNGDGSNSDLRGKYYTFINESGFYSLVLSSKLETTKKFKHWITSEVLPSLIFIQMLLWFQDLGKTKIHQTKELTVGKKAICEVNQI